MKRFRIVHLLACLVFVAGAARAQTGMNLAWNNCITQSNATGDKLYACDGSLAGTPNKLVFSFFAPTELPEFVGIEAIVEVHTDEAVLPDWWRLDSGECRAGAITVTGGLTGVGTGTTGACQTPWSGAQTGGGYRWWSESDGETSTPGRARLRMAWARDAWSPAALVANQQYVGGVILLDPFRDVAAEEDTTVCSGCGTSACIVLKEVRLFQNAGASGGDVQVITAAATRDYVTWQGSPAAGCPAAETSQARITWGSIRAVYH